MTIRWTIVYPRRDGAFYGLAETATTSAASRVGPGVDDCPFDRAEVERSELLVATDCSGGATWVLKNAHGRQGRVHGVRE